MSGPPPGRSGPLEDLVLLLQPLVLALQPGQLRCFGLLSGQGLGGAGRQTLVAPRPELVGVDAELGRHLLQGLAALLEPLDRLGLVLGGEPPPLALLRHRPLPVLVEPTLRRCPSSQGRLILSCRPLPCATAERSFASEPIGRRTLVPSHLETGHESG